MQQKSGYEYVTTPARIGEIADQASQAAALAVDLEADSLHHYFEKICLIQLGMGEHFYLIDPLTAGDVSALLKVFAAKPLILHGADYDVRMLHREGSAPPEIFDTMSAAQLLGYKELSYAALVEKHFGVKLSKQAQKANWANRPLPQKMLDYAVNDIMYLERLGEVMRAELEAAGRLDWHRQICRSLLRAATKGRRVADPDRQWRVKGWNVLKSQRALAVLRQLWQWRDAEGRRADLPAFKVVNNDILVALATWADAGQIPEDQPKLPRNCVGRRLTSLHQAIGRAMKSAPATWPQRMPPRPAAGSKIEKDLFARLKTARDKAAEELKVEHSILATAAALEAIAVAKPEDAAELARVSGLHKWQVDILAEPLLAALSKPFPVAAKHQRTSPEEQSETAIAREPEDKPVA